MAASFCSCWLRRVARRTRGALRLAAAIGDELAGRLAGSLAQAADTADDSGYELLGAALEAALDDMILPSDVYRIVPGRHTSSTFGGGYAEVSLPLVVVPVEEDSMFCMVFAASSSGELLAEPADGKPIDRCSDTEIVRLAEP